MGFGNCVIVEWEDGYCCWKVCKNADLLKTFPASRDGQVRFRRDFPILLHHLHCHAGTLQGTRHYPGSYLPKSTEELRFKHLFLYKNYNHVQSSYLALDYVSALLNWDLADFFTPNINHWELTSVSTQVFTVLNSCSMSIIVTSRIAAYVYVYVCTAKQF